MPPETFACSYSAGSFLHWHAGVPGADPGDFLLSCWGVQSQPGPFGRVQYSSLCCWHTSPLFFFGPLDSSSAPQDHIVLSTRSPEKADHPQDLLKAHWAMGNKAGSKLFAFKRPRAVHGYFTSTERLQGPA